MSVIQQRGVWRGGSGCAGDDDGIPWPLTRLLNLGSPLLQRGGDVLQQSWPTVDPEYLEVPDFVELSVLINNTACGTVTVPLQVSKDTEQVQQLILESPLGLKHLAERSIKRAILSPRTALINFLIDE
ncbi:probable leucine--tRNA ligase, mitochondrial [Lates japonicus]|uniref:Probable leucine--tRNA ligase, mitochondrial n=1 Tax=Lates japonicus TaxID=270547 RepID=A0AAD3MKE9_LATJO|nr:probable leucine--tRNA ligase, mitochondrial [Lates japonicus]